MASFRMENSLTNLKLIFCRTRSLFDGKNHFSERKTINTVYTVEVVAKRLCSDNHKIIKNSGVLKWRRRWIQTRSALSKTENPFMRVYKPKSDKWGKKYDVDIQTS